MTHHIAKQAGAAIAALFAAALFLGAPAYADPVSGNTTTVQMPTPGADSSGGTGSGSVHQSAPVILTEQGGSGGIDRDGTEGAIDPDGTTGTITGPLVTAIPAVRAAPAPGSPRAAS